MTKQKKFTGYIYQIKNVKRGIKYIGATSKSPRSRFSQHILKAYDDSWVSRSALHEDIRRFGPGWFKLEVLRKVTCDSKKALRDKLDMMEKAFIFIYDTYNNGYNETLGGRGTLGYNHRKETRKQISLKMSMQCTENSIGKKRPIVQLTLSGVVVKHWDSSSSAAKGIGCSRQSITNVLNGNAGQSTAKGFRFVYKSDFDKLHKK